MSLRAPFRFAAALSLPVILLAGHLAQALSPRRAAALEQFRKAEQMRADLEELPAADRNQHDYQRVAAAFRKVYLITPASSKADAAIENAAEVLEEEGRALDDEKASRQAVKEYNFLISQYPGSRFKAGAMFEIGKIYQADLGDNDQAREAYEGFLKLHPRHPLSKAARDALAELEKPAASTTAENDEPRPGFVSEVATESEKPTEAGAHDSATEHAAIITGIKQLPTADSTRVVISLKSAADQDLKYETGRVPSPDRIFFDLRNTRVGAGARGKTGAVDDGRLKKIRMAQYQPGMTRIVLEVAPASEFSSFVLPNPERLIIDIRGPKLTESAVAKPEVVAGGQTQTNDLPWTAGDRASDAKPAVMKMNASAAHAAAIAAPDNSAGSSGEKTTAALPPSQNESGTAGIAANTVKREKPKKVSTPTVAAEKAPSETEAARTSAAGTRSNSASAEVARLDDDAAIPAPQPKASIRKSASRQKNASRERSSEPAQAEAASNGREAAPAADGERTLIRALGLKIGKIVVDAGHGGHDTGTIGPGGLMEKNLVLDVTQRLGKLLQERLGAEVVYTRSDDTFIPLDERTAIANQAGADLFISVHANSSSDPSARGIETYYLNFTTDPGALEVASRENADSGESIHELQDLVKKIALTEKVEESRELASDVDHSLRAGLSTRRFHVRDRGVKKAPFVVLIGANMPSILAEISFLSNARDEHLLRQPEYRQKIAESLYRGVTNYVRGLSGIKLASAAH